jgi:hypothetical protein
VDCIGHGGRYKRFQWTVPGLHCLHKTSFIHAIDARQGLARYTLRKDGTCKDSPLAQTARISSGDVKVEISNS